MSSRKIKRTRRKPRVHGAKQARIQDHNLRQQAFKVAAQIRRKLVGGQKARGMDESGRVFVYCKLFISNSWSVEKHENELNRALLPFLGKEETDEVNDARDQTIQAFLQHHVDAGNLIPIECELGGVPVARRYADDGTIVVMRRGDPGAVPL